MFPAAARFAAWGAILALVGAAPRRPEPALATVRIAGLDYVRARDAADWLGLGIRWAPAEREWILADSAHRIAVGLGGRADGLEIRVDGLVVYLGDPAVEHGGELYLSRTDLERRLLPLVRPEWCGAPPPPPRLIVLDPGHGGDDPGTQNLRLHLQEKTFTLDTARRLKALLEARGFRVIMTRTGDYKLAPGQQEDLRLRGEMAVAARADLFLSIHFNAVPGADPAATQTRGTEVYTFPPEFQRSTQGWTAHLDDAERFPSPANREDLWNAVFAHAMHRELLRFLGTEDRGEKLRHLGVLRPLACPGILVESAFLSNDAEARRIADPAFRQRIAEGMLAGIEAYAAEVDALRARPAR